MGIVFANVAAFGQPFSASFYPAAFLTPARAVDDWLWLTQLVLIDGKMRGLFTVLFGAGLVLFLERARQQGAAAGLQLRRLCWLFVFGVAHHVLLWRGDILVAYAVAGVIALPFARWSGRRLLAFGLTAFAAGALISTAMYGFLAAAAAPQAAADPQLAAMHAGLVVEEEAARQHELAEGRVIAQGDYPQFVAGNLTGLPDSLGFNLALLLLETVPLVIMGMALYKAGFFTSGLDRSRMLAGSVAGVAVGAVVTLIEGLWEIDRGLTYWSSLSAVAGWSAFPRLPMIFGLAGLLVLLNDHAKGWFGTGLRAAGRAAFTNYIGTSVVMLWIFHGFGLGMFGQLNRAELYIVALVTAVAMPLWSQWWLARFRYGPLEWLWRCLTYGRVFALRQSMLA